MPFEKTYNQLLYVNPLTGKGQSLDPALPPVEGASFTITGSGFGAAIGYTDHIDTSGIYNTAEGQMFGAIGRRSGENYNGASNRPVVKSEGVAGGKCVYFYQPAFGEPNRAPNNVLPFYFDEPLGLGQKYFCSRWSKHHCPSSTVGGQRKLDRWQHELASVSDKASENYLSISSDITTFKITVRDFDDGTNGTLVYVSYNDKLVNTNKWVRFDTLQTMPTTLGGTDYKYEMWIHDPDGLSPPTYINFVQDGKFPAPYLTTDDFWRVHVPQNFFGNGDFGGEHFLWESDYYESLQYDTRVELSNNANYSLSTRSFIQPIDNATRSDTRIDVAKIKRGDITGGWLHVIKNSTGEVLKTVSVGGAA